MKPVIVSRYDPAWPAQFQQIRDALWPHLHDVAAGIEHVGSTSVPGLPAKAVIDIDVVIASPASLPVVVPRLESLGYQHRGDLGVKGREAFRAPAPAAVAHHLYVCIAGSLPLRNHLLLRDHLRAHPADAAAYGALKLRLAAEFPRDMDRYIAGKTAFIVDILARRGMSAEECAEIEAANRL